ncbi:hypothetical protein [Methanoculleus nereidis]|nr:hypothetical protein [Methanoculleus sp. YWC-01]
MPQLPGCWQVAGGIVAYIWARLFIKRLSDGTSPGQPAAAA